MGVISSHLDVEACKKRGVDVVTLHNRTKFQNQILQLLDTSSGHGEVPQDDTTSSTCERASSAIRLKQNVTGLDHVGHNFKHIVPGTDSGIKSITVLLDAYASTNQESDQPIRRFEETFQQLTQERDAQNKKVNSNDVAMAKALMWLYTYNGWVFKEMNQTLRTDDATKMSFFAPLIRALCHSYRHLQTHKIKCDTLYRRANLSAENIRFYSLNREFYWPSFTSTTTVLPRNGGNFGPVLFQITVPDYLKEEAIDISSFSAIPTEAEVLLPPNVNFIVTEVDTQPDVDEYPATDMVIHIRMMMITKAC
jgi:hypothetical protein